MFTYLILILTIGTIALQLSKKKTAPGLQEKILQLSVGDTTSFRGQILKAKNTGYYHQYIIRVHSYRRPASASIPVDFKILVRAKWTQLKTLPKAGEKITFKGVMEKIPEVKNPHEFNYREYLASENIHLECQLTKIKRITPIIKYDNWFWWREKINKIIDRNFSPSNIPVAMALLLGDKSALSKQTKSNFNRAGISHLLAVSGLHVGFIIMPFWFLVPWFWYHKKGKPFAILLIAGVLFLYAGITGFRLSVIRASIMAFLFLFARVYQKKSNSINIMATAALLILFVNPTALFDVSFQLSFGAVAVILLLYPVIQRTLPQKLRYGKFSFLPTIVIISIIVQFGLFPLLIWYFHQFSIIAPVANIFAIPMAQVIVLWSWICIGLGALFPVIGHLANWPSNLLVNGLRSLSQHLTMLRWSWINVRLFSPLLFITWVSILMLITVWHNKRLRWKWLIIFMISLIVIQIPFIYQKMQPPVLKLTVFDVGQGDALFLQTPEHKHIFIDTGVWHLYSNSGDKILVPELQAMGIRHIDAIILTHPHADHIGGVVSLIKHFSVDTIYNSGIPHKSKLYHRYLRLARVKHIPVKHLHRGYPLSIDSSIGLFVLSPGTHITSDKSYQHSIVLKVVYGQTSFLFTGDVEKPSEIHMDHIFGSFLESDLLKVAHHGSNTSSSSGFLKLVNPRIAVISAGHHNRYHLPDKTVINRIIKSGASIHYTSLEHALIFTSDGKHITEREWKNQ